MAPVTIELLFVASLLVLGAESQQHYNYPAKNINLDSTTFSSYYSLQAPGCCSAFSSSQVDDFQAVAGIELAAGGYLLVGKGIDQAEPNPAANECGGYETEGFAVKVSSSGAYEWGYLPGTTGSNVLNGVIELSNGEILVAGYRTVSSAYSRSLTKLSSNGAEIWTATFGDAAGSRSVGNGQLGVRWDNTVWRICYGWNAYLQRHAFQIIWQHWIWLSSGDEVADVSSHK